MRPTAARRRARHRRPATATRRRCGEGTQGHVPLDAPLAQPRPRPPRSWAWWRRPARRARRFGAGGARWRAPQGPPPRGGGGPRVLGPRRLASYRRQPAERPRGSDQAVLLPGAQGRGADADHPRGLATEKRIGPGCSPPSSTTAMEPLDEPTTRRLGCAPALADVLQGGPLARRRWVHGDASGADRSRETGRIGAEDQHAEPVRHDGHRDVERRARVQPGRHRGARLAAVGLASPAAIIVGFIPVLFIAIAYYYLNRRTPTAARPIRGSAARSTLTSAGSRGGFSWPPTCCSARPLRSSPARTRCSCSTAFPGRVSADAANDNRTDRRRRGGVARAGDLHGGSWHPRHRELPVDPGVHRVLDRARLCALGDRQDRRRPARRQRASPPSWFNPGCSCTTSTAWRADSALGVFFFWGWDTAANVNEESKDADEIPGLAGIISMFILLFIFLIAAIAMQPVITQHGDRRPQQPERHPLLLRAADLGELAGGVPDGAGGALVDRRHHADHACCRRAGSRYSMARDGVFPKAFGTVHKSW